MRNLRLTPRECAVARCLMEGWTNARIAAELSLNLETLKSHMYRLFCKCGQDERVNLVVFLLRNDWALAQVMETSLLC
jgi:DNA-binding NarL/FixJ family response regulator